MDICLFLPALTGFGATLERLVGDIVPNGNLTVLRALTELAAASSKFFQKGCVFVLHAPDSASLEDILSIRDRILQHRIILVVPDDLPSTLSSGHLLHPRLQVSEGEEALEIVPAVLQKMINRRISMGSVVI